MTLPWPPTLSPLLELIIIGDPITQGSLRTFRNGGIAYPKTTVNHRNRVVDVLTEHWAGKPPLTGPLAVRADFRFHRPEAHYLPRTKTRPARTILRDTAPKWHTTKGRGDADKLARLVGDALEIARVISHDSLISAWRIEKAYTTDVSPVPSTVLSVYQLENTP
jgi:Holliday junction resolvase RusA-like endonuclease